MEDKNIFEWNFAQNRCVTGTSKKGTVPGDVLSSNSLSHAKVSIISYHTSAPPVQGPGFI